MLPGQAKLNSASLSQLEKYQAVPFVIHGDNGDESQSPVGKASLAKLQSSDKTDEALVGLLLLQ